MQSLPRSRAWCPLGRISALLEGLTPPRASLRLARGIRTPKRVSASLEAALNPRCRTNSLDWSIKCSGTSWAPGANPRHAGPLTPPGNHIPVLFDQPALCGHPRRCAGRSVSFHDTVLPTLVPPPRPPPQKRTAAPSKGVRSPTLHPPGTRP
jgi:hypothetical protein